MVMVIIYKKIILLGGGDLVKSVFPTTKFLIIDFITLELGDNGYYT